jgi:hypothetical protein
MTPAEKSDELYLKYKKALNIQNDMRPGKNPFAQQCAIICVEQIMEELKDVQEVTGSSFVHEEINQWGKVIEHIKNS